MSTKRRRDLLRWLRCARACGGSARAASASSPRACAPSTAAHCAIRAGSDSPRRRDPREGRATVASHSPPISASSGASTRAIRRSSWRACTASALRRGLRGPRTPGYTLRRSPMRPHAVNASSPLSGRARRDALQKEERIAARTTVRAGRPRVLRRLSKVAPTSAAQGQFGLSRRPRGREGRRHVRARGALSRIGSAE